MSCHTDLRPWLRLRLRAAFSTSSSCSSSPSPRPRRRTPSRSYLVGTYSMRLVYLLISPFASSIHSHPLRSDQTAHLILIIFATSSLSPPQLPPMLSFLNHRLIASNINFCSSQANTLVCLCHYSIYLPKNLYALICFSCFFQADKDIKPLLISQTKKTPPYNVRFPFSSS